MTAGRPEVHRIRSELRRLLDSAGPVLLVLWLGPLAACRSQPGGPAGGGNHQETVPVTVATVLQRNVPIQLHAIGTVEASSTVSIKSQVEGQLAEIHFQEGDPVRKGDLLFTIDPRPFEATLRQVEANLARDAAEAENAKVEAERLERLLSQALVSRSEYDQAHAKATSLLAAVKADQAAVENSKLQLQYCYIRSPIDGRIGQLLVHAGNVVKRNETELAVVNQIRPVHVAFSVPEQELPEIRQRAAATRLTVEAFATDHATTPVTGQLNFINNQVDTTTGTVLLKAFFDNADETLWPGQFVDVALTLTIQRNAVVVPTEAAQTGQQGAYVYVVDKDLAAQLRPIVVGQTVGQEVIISKGPEAGERVVTDGQLRLAPGFKVQIKEHASGLLSLRERSGEGIE